MDKKKLKRDLLIWFVLFGVLTLPFIFSNLDIKLQSPYFSIEQGWYLSKLPFWDFIYKYGIFLGYFLVVGALITLSVSYWRKAIVKWRRPAFFLLFVMILGPGVLVNATLKDHWGHPRPREIKEFGGKEDYVKVWVKGPTKGKSFPCGHASMGFFLSIPFLFLRHRYKKWAWVFFIFGTLYGLLIGYARMIAGGHFASDVLWAAGIVWLTAILSFYFLKVNKPIPEIDVNNAAQKRKKRLATILVGAVLPILTVGLLLATPYISHRTFDETKVDLEKYSIQQFNIHFTEGIVNVNYGDDFIVDFKVNAFGFPNSKIGWLWEPGKETNFALTRMGWFTEVRNEIELTLIDTPTYSHTVKVDEGDVYFKVPTDTIPKVLNIEIEEGTLYLSFDEQIPDYATSVLTDSFEGGELQNKDFRIGNLQLNVQLAKKAKLVIEK